MLDSGFGLCIFEFKLKTNITKTTPMKCSKNALIHKYHATPHLQFEEQ